MIYPTTFLRFRKDDDILQASNPGDNKPVGYVASRDDIDKVISSINERLKKDVEPFPANPKVYLGKTCKLDRDKIKTLFSTNKFDKTRVAEYADLIILDKYNQSIQKEKLYLLDKDRAEIAKQALIKAGCGSAANALARYMLQSPTVSIVVGSWESDGFGDILTSGGLSDCVSKWLDVYYVFRKWGANKEVDILNNMILCNSNEKAQILDSNKFNGDILQKDLMVIDEETYDTLSEIAKAKQIDDTKMLANLIDNCNLKESHYFIHLLVLDNVIHGTSKLSYYLRKETHDYLMTIGKKYFDQETSSYSIRFILNKISRDNDYKLIPRLVNDVESTLLFLLKREIKDHFYWLNDFSYEPVGIENINIKPKIKSNEQPF